MAKLWAIIKREYLERVRTRWFIFATIFGPIFFGAIIIVPAVLALLIGMARMYTASAQPAFRHTIFQGHSSRVRGVRLRVTHRER